MIRLIIVLLLAGLVSGCQAQQGLYITATEGNGIEVPNSGDGKWAPKEVAGREAIAGDPSSGYLYFKLTPEARQTLGSDFWILVDFLDQGMGSVLVEFNSTRANYDKGTTFLMTNGGEWQRALLHVENAALKGAQNWGSDFRLAFFGGIIISRLEVMKEKPDIQLPDDMERMATTVARLPKLEAPKTMFYTFGSDADEATLMLFKAIGVTSIESYVTWETCEQKGEGQWDWSKWDQRVEELKRQELKWVPFLILGPAYSTPDWFRASDQHYPCACLEHGTASKIESLWNPNLPRWIDRFLAAFAERYKDSGVIESVLLGIQGDFGEAIYSVAGDWTQIIPGEYHNHAGFWCNDKYALADFREWAKAKYGDRAKLNRAWGTNYTSFEAVDYPARGEGVGELKSALPTAPGPTRRHWLDFVEWYRASMTDWSDWWMATTRKYFPKTPIYLCTGGSAPPEHGSDFAEQCRVAAKHQAGVRITNEGSHYSGNVAITRWVASAGKFYGAYFAFEPASLVDANGIVARFYNAIASGANQLHEYDRNAVADNLRLERQRACLPFLEKRNPIVPLALWYPNTSLSIKWGGHLEQAVLLRDLVDYDWLDETLLAAGALERHKLLVIASGNVMETADATRIADWVTRGGRLLVVGVPAFMSVEQTDAPEKTLFGSTSAGRSLGKGAVKRLANMTELATELGQLLPAFNLPLYDCKADGLFGTQVGPKEFLYLNYTDGPLEARVSLGDKTVTAEVEPRAIKELTLPE